MAPPSSNLTADNRRASRNPDFDPFQDRRITPEHYYLLERLGDEVLSLSELEALGDPETVDTVIRELVHFGAITVDSITDEVPIIDQTDLTEIDEREQRLLEEQVDLEEWEKRRLISVQRTLESGDLYEFLGVKASSSKRDLKRAYFELSKEYHPDRYFGRSLGSFGPMLAEIFVAATQAVKSLSDSRTTTGDASGKKRRKSERLVFRASVVARCASWETAEQLVTQDLSDGGLFLCTALTASIGERARIEITSQTYGTLKIDGTVAWLRPASEAARLDLLPGFGIRFDNLVAAERTRWRQILDQVRRVQPVAATESPVDEDGRAVNFARGTSRFRRSPVVGIDFGTSYTSVSAAIENRVRLLPWPDGSISIPSVVAFPAPGRHVVGQRAKDRLLTDPKHTVASAKRLLGRRASDREIEGHLATAAFSHGVAPDGNILVDMWGEQYHVAQICSYLLRAAKDAAEHALDHEVEQAVIAVPVSFSADAIQLIRKCGQLAHLEIVDVIAEPNGAALANRAYPDFGGLVGIYDFGGGTFDFSVVDASGGDFRVLATTGDSWLGGDDLDLEVANAVADLVSRARGIDLRNRAVEWQHLLFSCEGAKRTLSKRDIAEVCVPEVLRSDAGALDLKMKLRRSQAEKLWRTAIERSLTTCTQALNLLGLKPQDLSQVYLSGGTTYTPAVRQAVQARFNIPVRTLVPPEFAVCLGAGIHAAQLERRRPVRGLKSV